MDAQRRADAHSANSNSSKFTRGGLRSALEHYEIPNNKPTAHGEASMTTLIQALILVLGTLAILAAMLFLRWLGS